MHYVLGSQFVYGTVIILLFGLLIVFADGISINGCDFFAKIVYKSYSFLHFGGGGLTLSAPFLLRTPLLTMMSMMI